VEWLGGTDGQLLRLSIDRVGGISAKHCAAVSRAVSPLLDEDDPIVGRYRLEVSSPGMDRPVQRPEDFERFAGYQIKIRLEPGPERRRYTGVLKGCLDDDVVIDVEGQEHRFHLESIARARLVLSGEEYRTLGSQSTVMSDEEILS